MKPEERSVERTRVFLTSKQGKYGTSKQVRIPGLKTFFNILELVKLLTGRTTYKVVFFVFANSQTARAGQRKQLLRL